MPAAPDRIEAIELLLHELIESLVARNALTVGDLAEIEQRLWTRAEANRGSMAETIKHAGLLASMSRTLLMPEPDPMRPDASA